MSLRMFVILKWTLSYQYYQYKVFIALSLLLGGRITEPTPFHSIPRHATPLRGIRRLAIQTHNFPNQLPRISRHE
jgi:hypothetical protein